nr:cytochrome P450 [Pseudonocardia sp. TRM90224]
MRALKSRIIGYIARRAFGGGGGGGLSAAKLSLLPESALLPLKRDGLDPVDWLRDHRESGGISRIKLPLGVTVWLVSGYDAAKSVLGATATFSNDFRQLAGAVGFGEDENPGGLGFSDPPDHTRLRRVLTPEFTGRRLSRLVPRVQGIVDEQLDAMAAAAEKGPVDIVAMFALPVPSLSICELLGVPYEDRADFQRLSTARFDLGDGAEASLAAVNDSLPYLRGIVERQRVDPGEGLLGRLVSDHGEEFTDHELAGIADGLLTGGLETTTSTLALGTVILLNHPEYVTMLREDSAAVDPFVEELLRYLSVVQVAFPRFAREDVEVAGQLVKKGDVVIPSLSGANRDATLRAAESAEMEAFDPRRGVVRHLAFGYGIHRCVGAELAKLELRAAFPALVARFPEMRMAEPPADLAYRKYSIVHGLDRLLVDLAP